MKDCCPDVPAAAFCQAVGRGESNGAAGQWGWDDEDDSTGDSSRAQVTGCRMHKGQPEYTTRSSERLALRLRRLILPSPSPSPPAPPAEWSSSSRSLRLPLVVAGGEFSGELILAAPDADAAAALMSD